MKRALLLVLASTIPFSVLASNPMYEHAKGAGVKQSLPAIKRVSEFLLNNGGRGESGVVSLWNKNAPDTSPFNSVIETDYASGMMMYVDVTVTPTSDGECHVSYQKVFNFRGSCQKAAQSLEGVKYVGELNERIAMYEGGTATLYLIPNGDQCTVVRKETTSNGLKSQMDSSRRATSISK